MTTEREKILAQALLNTATTLDDSGRNAFVLCNHCSGPAYSYDPQPPIEHEKDCPVLIAQEIVG